MDILALLQPGKFRQYQLRANFSTFFHPEPTGQRTGLGLSLSYDIVTKGHGRTLTVESGEGGRVGSFCCESIFPIFTS